jgi:hypothetical protein
MSLFIVTLPCILMSRHDHVPFLLAFISSHFSLLPTNRDFMFFFIVGMPPPIYYHQQHISKADVYNLMSRHPGLPEPS